MSFLNPVNEPVLRFKSTDAGAPQINYNVRTAGDIKAVLKACLVTGYGAISSAGWSAVNEVANVIEFVSPSAAMSDYRLGIDDTSTSTTTWYYQYQGVRTNPSYASPTKLFANANKTSEANGWQLLATERGIVLIELVQHSAINKLSARITYWGAIKSALIDTSGQNVCFFNVGHNSTTSQPSYFYDRATFIHTQLSSYTSAQTSAATSNILSVSGLVLDVSKVDLISPIYISGAANTLLIAELPPMLSKIVNSTTDLYGISDFLLDGRDVISVCAGYDNTVANRHLTYSRTFLIRTDYWGY